MNDVYTVFSIVLACVWTVMGAVVLYLGYRIAKALECPARLAYGPSVASRGAGAGVKGCAEALVPNSAFEDIKAINELLDKTCAEQSAARTQSRSVLEVHTDNLGQEIDLSAPVDRRMTSRMSKKP